MARKPVSEFKLATLPEWQQQKIRADEAKAKSAQVQGSSLKTFSAKRLSQFGTRTMYSTFTTKPGQRPLQRVRRVDGHRVKTVQQRPMVKGKPLKYQGKRGRRLAPEDRKQEAASHALPCVCGCSAHLQPGVNDIPGKGLISRAHLESRRFESTRNEDWNNLPACLFLNDFLDHTSQGEEAKARLLEIAKEKRERLTLAEVHPVLSENGYYTWLHDRRIP